MAAKIDVPTGAATPSPPPAITVTRVPMSDQWAASLARNLAIGRHASGEAGHAGEFETCVHAACASCRTHTPPQPSGAATPTEGALDLIPCSTVRDALAVLFGDSQWDRQTWLIVSKIVDGIGTAHEHTLEQADYAVIVEAIEDYLGFDCTTRKQQNRITQWAHLRAAHGGRKEEQQQRLIDDLYVLFTSTPAEIAAKFGDSTVKDDHCRVNYALELMEDFVSDNHGSIVAKEDHSAAGAETPAPPQEPNVTTRDAR
jgi:hypothetical protein